MQTMPLRLRHEERISNSPEVLAAASIQPQNSGLVAYAPRVSEDLLAGGPALREAFASAPFHIAQRCKMLVSASDTEPPVLRVEHGMAFSSCTLPDGRRAITDIFLPTDFIGIEHAVADHAPTEITAAGALRYRALSASAFRERFIVDPQVALRVLAVLTEQSVRRNRHAFALTRLDARERMADFLVGIYDRLRLAGLAPRPIFNLPFTQNQIAEHLGMTMVHVSRTCRRLRDERLVITDRQVIIIKDVEGLRRVAGALATPGAGENSASGVPRASDGQEAGISSAE